MGNYLIWDRKRFEKKFGKKGTEDTELLFNKIEKNDFISVQCEFKKINELLQEFERFGDHFILVGGDDLIPFGRVKNPCMDGDEKVLTDNIYSSTDKDILLPERIISRIPDGSDLGFLHYIIENLGNPFNGKKPFGYTAKVWTNASKEVFSVINGKEILISPPYDHNSIKINRDSRYFYFNLHGSDQTPFWYGQEGNRYPIALKPENLKDVEDGISASEACYGAYIINKRVEDAISLTLLSKGIKAFVGSTTIAYGPSKPPSTEADLIVKLFFEEFLNGKTAGESFYLAKHKFFKKMIKTQGFLDEDDQKTLLQFVLYGDPTIKIKEEKWKKRI